MASLIPVLLASLHAVSVCLVAIALGLSLAALCGCGPRVIEDNGVRFAFVEWGRFRWGFFWWWRRDDDERERERERETLERLRRTMVSGERFREEDRAIIMGYGEDIVRADEARERLERLGDGSGGNH